MRISMSLLVLPLIVAGLSATAGARQNHCDHNGGKIGGAIAGTIIGGVIGGLIDHGGAGGIALGAGGGAGAGALIGHESDAEQNYQECGDDAPSRQRQIIRNENADDRRYDNETRRQREIRHDREEMRRRYGRRNRWEPNYQAPPFVAPGPWQCQEIENGYALVYVPTNQITDTFWSSELGKCRRESNYKNGY